MTLSSPAGVDQLPDEDEISHTRSRYNLSAPVYDLVEWPVERLFIRGWREQLWASVEGPEVLEIGVGTGKNIPHYPDDIRVTAVDLAPRMVTRARRRARRHPEKDVTIHEMDAQTLAFSDEQFDEVVATMVFCSVPDPVLGLQEAKRVTKPGGSLHLLEHMRASSPILGRLMDVLDSPIHWAAGMHVARETVENVRRAGWDVQTVRSLSFADIFRRIEAKKPS